MDLWKPSDLLQIKIKISDPSHKHPAFSTAPNQDDKDMDILCTYKAKIEDLKLEIVWNKDSKSIQIKIKITSPNEEPPVSAKAMQ